MDQVLLGMESKYLSSEKITQGRRKFLSEKSRSSELGNHQKIRIQIWDTLHYQLLSNPGEYAADYKKYVEEAKQPEHNLETFSKLITEFSLHNLRNFKIRVRRVGDSYIVDDGFHRLALYYFVTKSHVISTEFLEFSNSLPPNLPNLQKSQRKFLKSLKKTRGGNFYNHWNVSKFHESGYHSFECFGLSVFGQRRPIERISQIDKYLPFLGKNVLDLGCNAGGMLFHLEHLGKAIGFDFDKRAIRSANFLLKLIKTQNPEFASRFEFQQLDLNKEYEFVLSQTIAKYRIDTALLLSLGSWVKNWKSLYEFIHNAGLIIVLETNNIDEGAEQLELFRLLGSKITLISSQSVDDFSGNLGRATYLVIPDKGGVQ